MGVGLTIANSTTYHVFVILNAGAADIYFDTNATAANKPSGTTAFRRIGSILTDGSAHIVAFVQNGDRFDLGTPIQEYSATPGVTTAATLTLTGVPSGVVTQAILSGLIQDTSGSEAAVYLSSLATADVAAYGFGNGITAITGSGSSTYPAFASWSGLLIITNTSRGIRRRCDYTTSALTIFTNGWIDQRGRQ
jgi:hypothetical protein